MFARVLYVDDRLALELNWLGYGALRVVHRDGAVRVAHPIQKKAFFTLVGAFEALGQPISPSNPKFSAMAKHYAEMLEHPPTSLHWRTFFASDPSELARGFAEQ